MSDDPYASVRQQFGPQAEKYVQASTFRHGEDLQILLDWCQPKPDWCGLDIATGGGHTAFTFAPHVAQMTATDVTEAMVSAAARFAAEQGLNNIAFQTAAAESLPFSEGSFDLVTCRIAPHHFVSIPQFLAEASRVLKPGGVFGLIDGLAPESDDQARIYNDWERLRDPSHVACLSLSDWRDALDSAGFTIDHEMEMRRKHNFDEYVERMDVPLADRETLLESMLHDPAVHDWINPELGDTGYQFFLHNGLFAVRKRS